MHSLTMLQKRGSKRLKLIAEPAEKAAWMMKDHSQTSDLRTASDRIFAVGGEFRTLQNPRIFVRSAPVERIMSKIAQAKEAW
jgi:hypothetical protein